METTTSCEVGAVYEDLWIEPTNGIQVSEVNQEVKGDSTNQHLCSIKQNLHPTNHDSEEAVDLISTDLLEDELTDLISEAKQCLLRQSSVCDDGSDSDFNANDYRVPGVLTEGYITTQSIKVNNNIDLQDNELVSLEKDIVTDFQELNLSSGLHSEGCQDVEEKKHPEVDLETLSDLQEPVSDSSDTSDSTDTTPRNSSSEDTSEVEEDDADIMRWKKKGDHREYSKEEFMEEYSQVNSRKTREKNSNKRSQKKDRTSVDKEFIKNDEACGVGRVARRSNGRTPDVLRTTELANGPSAVVATRESVSKSQAACLEKMDLTANAHELQKQMSPSGFGGGFFIAPPKPPRIQSQLSEPALAGHLEAPPNAHRPRTARSISLPPVPPPKPRRSVVKDEKSNEAENYIGNTMPVSKKEAHVTKGSMGHSNGVVNTDNIPSSPITSLAADVEIHRDSEITFDNSIISSNFSDANTKLIRRRATESSLGLPDHQNPDHQHPDHQPPHEMGNGVIPDGANVILRSKQKRSTDSKDRRNSCQRPLTAALGDFPDDGLLRDDITGNQEVVEVGSDDDQYFDGDMHVRGWTWVYIGDDAELSAKLENEGQEHRKTVKDASKDDTSSISTTVSEKEFKIQVKTSIKRKCSEIDYQRVSMFVRERDICLKKKNGVFGFRIQRSRPVVVTEVDKGGAAEESGIKVGDVIVSINGNDVSSAPHSDVVKLASCTNENDQLTLVVGTNVCNSFNLGSDQPVMSGYMYKRGGTGLMQSWKKRWFVLKHDNCLYYYKTEHDVDPLGAIVLASYTMVKAWDLDKPFAFKLKKFKARTYYFYTASEDERNKWAFAITEATHPLVKSDIWMGITTHNVGVPALSINNPECIGHLTKRGGKHKTWRRRFFVLKDACMYYYENNNSPTALGVVHFHGYTIQEIRTNNKKFLFDLIPPEPDLRTYHFQADHETDRKRWVAALASSIGKWVRTDVCNSDDDEGCEMLI